MSDGEDEEIPDEDVNTDEMVRIHNQIVPRGSITSNILTHSFCVNAPFTQLSVSDLSRIDKTSLHKNALISSHSSFNSSQRDVFCQPHEFSSHQKNLKIIDETVQDRALFNWGKLFSKCMLEYRRHRLRKAFNGLYAKTPKNIHNMMMAPQMSQQFNKMGSPREMHSTRKHQARHVANPTPMYDFYP